MLHQSWFGSLPFGYVPVGASNHVEIKRRQVLKTTHVCTELGYRHLERLAAYNLGVKNAIDMARTVCVLFLSHPSLPHLRLPKANLIRSFLIAAPRRRRRPTAVAVIAKEFRPPKTGWTNFSRRGDDGLATTMRGRTLCHPSWTPCHAGNTGSRHGRVTRYAVLGVL